MRLFDLFKKNKNKKEVKKTTLQERYLEMLNKLYDRIGNNEK